MVLDTSVLVAAMRSDLGASRQLLLAALGGRISVVASVALVLEYESVLTREEHLRAAGVSRKEMLAVVDALVSVAIPVKLSFQWRPMLGDADDDLVLEAAANGQAGAIVTLNVRDFSRVPPFFGIEILSPGEVLKRVRQI